MGVPNRIRRLKGKKKNLDYIFTTDLRARCENNYTFMTRVPCLSYKATSFSRCPRSCRREGVMALWSGKLSGGAHFFVVPWISLQQMTPFHLMPFEYFSQQNDTSSKSARKLRIYIAVYLSTLILINLFNKKGVGILRVPAHSSLEESWTEDWTIALHIWLSSVHLFLFW